MLESTSGCIRNVSREIVENAEYIKIQNFTIIYDNNYKSGVAANESNDLIPVKNAPIAIQCSLLLCLSEYF